ncbi:hypothetical protein CORC01_07258 [Colletotrichum orchidophilum]|uniref:Uncharacterized protein n=1 Tax=Colletotrichum orchidophilum TaxID=1209926 RepID=A0A1G4B812_9PEZI|nr:uncharacterized protein CORC01_07258 [Colletotrichum orchidophilum]OHE97476.1 hypothetical protein CORC01_07258 [Colletotrichum orchidophilum]
MHPGKATGRGPSASVLAASGFAPWSAACLHIRATAISLFPVVSDHWGVLVTTDGKGCKLQAAANAEIPKARYLASQVPAELSVTPGTWQKPYVTPSRSESLGRKCAVVSNGADAAKANPMQPMVRNDRMGKSQASNCIGSEHPPPMPVEGSTRRSYQKPEGNLRALVIRYPLSVSNWRGPDRGRPTPNSPIDDLYLPLSLAPIRQLLSGYFDMPMFNCLPTTPVALYNTNAQINVWPRHGDVAGTPKQSSYHDAELLLSVPGPVRKTKPAGSYV